MSFVGGCTCRARPHVILSVTQRCLLKKCAIANRAVLAFARKIPACPWCIRPYWRHRWCHLWVDVLVGRVHTSFCPLLSDVCRRNAPSQIKLFWPLDEKFEPAHGVFCPTDDIDDVICGWMYLSGASTRHFDRYVVIVTAKKCAIANQAVLAFGRKNRAFPWCILPYWRHRWCHLWC